MRRAAPSPTPTKAPTTMPVMAPPLRFEPFAVGDGEGVDEETREAGDGSNVKEEFNVGVEAAEILDVGIAVETDL